MSNNMRKFNSVAEIRAAIKAGGSHFFDADTMKFFGSRVEQGVYGPNGRVFITSEQVPDYLGRRVGRRWTVREVVERESERLSVNTVGNFMQFGTLSGARRAAKSYAEAGAA